MEQETPTVEQVSIYRVAYFQQVGAVCIQGGISLSSELLKSAYHKQHVEIRSCRVEKALLFGEYSPDLAIVIETIHDYF